MTGMGYDSRSIIVGSGATSAAIAIAETSSDDAIDDGIISVVPVTGATMVVTRTRNSGGVGCPISSLKVAPRLLETGVSVTSTEEL